MPKKMEYIVHLSTSIIFLLLALMFLNLDVGTINLGGAHAGAHGGAGLLILLAIIIFAVFPEPFGKYFAVVGCVLISAYALRLARRIKRD